LQEDASRGIQRCKVRHASNLRARATCADALSPISDGETRATVVRLLRFYPFLVRNKNYVKLILYLSCEIKARRIITFSGVSFVWYMKFGQAGAGSLQFKPPFKHRLKQAE
jgi:hypothetical protein